MGIKSNVQYSCFIRVFKDILRILLLFLGIKNDMIYNAEFMKE